MKRDLNPWGVQCKMQMVALGKTLADLSDSTGFSRTYISAIINGRVVVPESTRSKISKELKVDLIMTESEKE